MMINMMSMMGQDVDCNAAQVATMFGAAQGIEAISEKWLKPLPEELLTYVRGHEKTSIADITSFTVECVNRALENRQLIKSINHFMATAILWGLSS